MVAVGVEQQAIGSLQFNARSAQQDCCADAVLDEIDFVKHARPSPQSGLLLGLCS